MSPFSPGRPLGRSLRRASARAAIGRGAALPTDARNYAYALHAPKSGSGMVCLGVVPARSTWRREAALSQLHRVTGTCRLSLALPPATPNVTRWPLLIECLARTATWDAPADFEPEMMGRRSLPPAMTPSPLLSACWTCASHSARVMSLISSCREGLCAGCSRAGWSVLLRLSIPIFAAPRAATSQCVARRINRTSGCPASERGPAARPLLRESCHGSPSASFADLPQRAA